MANAIYPKWKEAIIQGDATAALNGSGTTGVYVALIDTGTYTYSATHQYYSDLSGIVGTPVEITSKTYTNGLFDGADSTHTSVTGSSVEALVFYIQNAGANTTWRLYAYMDTSITGMPLTPNTGDINEYWNASGIVQL